MLKPVISLTALTAAISAPFAAHAADNKELAEIREQIKQLKDSYENRIQALETRLKEAESKAQSAQASADQANAKTAETAKAAPTAQAGQTKGGGIAAFNPAISAVLQGTYTNLSQDPNHYKLSGFIPGGEIGPGKRGFSLAETELTVSSNIDDKFFGQTTLSVTPDDQIAAEEAYILTTSLPSGFTAKAGRFFSNIGYQNEQHQHAWDFVDAPLVYQAFLGGQFGNDGIQLKWVAPTDLYLEFGAEAGSGENFPGTNHNKNGSGSGALTAKLGGDIGYSTSWRVGLSGLRTRAENREFTQTDLSGNDAQNSFTGKSRIAIADFVIKYAPNGNPLVTNFKLQGEYFRRKEDGNLTYDSNGALTTAGLGMTNTDAYRSNQSGWYLQSIYQFMPYWRVGLRYDRLSPGLVDLASNSLNLDAPGFNPHKTTLMIDWSPSEFSRIRLQGARDRTQAGTTDNQIYLQYIMTMGAHGAHKF